MIDTATITALRMDGTPYALTLAELEQWGRQLGASVKPQTVIALLGDLGAGKTTMARAICEGFGVSDIAAVTSPTYAILQEYDAPNGVVVHADLYRLKSDRELEALGWDEIVAAARVLIVEWPERAMAGFPSGTCVLQLAHDVTDSSRRLVAASIT